MLTQMIAVASEEFKYFTACTQYKLSGNNMPLKKVLINGSPKTGTTWVLMMMASIPGYQKTSGYNFKGNIDLYHQVLPGDVIHGHDPYTPELGEILDSNKIKVILTVRDPRDQAISRMFHVKRDITHKWHQKFHTLSADEALMACIEGRDGLPGVKTMFGLTQSWLNAGNKVYCIKYEDLLTDPNTGLKQILKYLEINATDNLIHAIVKRNRFKRLTIGKKFWKAARKPGEQDAKSHFRKGIVGDWKNYFTPVHIQRFKEIAGETLIALGYEKDHNW